MYSDPAGAILAHIIRLGPSSRADLAREMQLSPASLSRIVRPLIERGLLSDELSGVSSSGMGRPSQLLEVPAASFIFAGINLGFRELHGVLTNVRAEVLCQLTSPLDDRSPTAIAEATAALAGDLLTLFCESRSHSVVSGSGDSRNDIHLDIAPPTIQGLTIAADEPFVDGLRHSDQLLSLGTPIDTVNTTDGLAILEQWFGVGREHHAFVLTTVDDDVRTRRVESNNSTPPALISARRQDPTAHLPLAGATGICQYGHVGCAAGALTRAAVIARARSGRLLIGDNEHRPFNLADLTYLAEIGDLPSRSALTEFGANLATFVTIVGRASGVTNVVLDGECVALVDSPWVIDSFETAMSSFSVPGLAPLHAHSRTGYSMRQARGGAAAAISTWVSRVLSDSIHP